MKSVHTSIGTLVLSLLTLLVLFPSCGKQKELQQETPPPTVKAPETPQQPAAADVTLASINNKPLLTKQEFEQYLNQIDEAQPGIKEWITHEPTMEQSFLNSIVDQKLIKDHWIKDKGIDKTPEYQNLLKQFMEMGTMQIANQKFEESVMKDFKVTDAEVKKYYNENKKRFVKTPGGVKAQEVVFGDERAANDFLAKAKVAGANFKELAKQAGKEVNDLGIVTRETMGVDPALKSKLLKVTKVPSIDLIKVDKEFHVVNSTDKTAEEYQTLDEAQELIKQMITYEKAPAMVQEKKQDLRKQYKVDINEEYFQEKAKALEKEMADTAEVDEGDETLIEKATDLMEQVLPPSA